MEAEPDMERDAAQARIPTPDRLEAALHAYCDGELGAFARWRFERRLARSEALQIQLEELRRLGDWVRESEPAAEAGADAEAEDAGEEEKSE